VKEDNKTENKVSKKLLGNTSKIDSNFLKLDGTAEKPPTKKVEIVKKTEGEIRLEIVQLLRIDMKRLLAHNTVDKASLMTGRYQMSQILKTYFNDAKSNISLSILMTSLELHYKEINAAEENFNGTLKRTLALLLSKFGQRKVIASEKPVLAV
jgi:hypothetical protein